MIFDWINAAKSFLDSIQHIEYLLIFYLSTKEHTFKRSEIFSLYIESKLKMKPSLFVVVCDKKMKRIFYSETMLLISFKRLSSFVSHRVSDNREAIGDFLNFPT